MSKNEKLVAQIAGSMAIEGMRLNKTEKKSLLDCANGTKSSSQVIKQLVSRYKVQ